MNLVTPDLERRAPSQGPLDGRRILLVTDSATAAVILARMVRGTGGRLRCADGVEAALHHLRAFRPELLVVDLGLSDGDGRDLIAQAAAMRLARPRIVVLSGRDIAAEATLPGVDVVLRKPASRANLLAALSRAPAGASQQRAGNAPARDVTPAMVANLRRAQLCLLEAQLAGRCASQVAFGLPFVASVIEMSQDPSLHACRAALRSNSSKAMLAAIKTWLSVADPKDFHGKADTARREVAGR